MLYISDNYKDAVLAALMQKRQLLGRAYSRAHLAKACNIQSSYLSRVLKGDAHLSPDQLFLASEFLRLDKDERQFLSLLYERDRTGLKMRRTALTDAIEKVRVSKSKTEAVLPLQTESPTSPDWGEYFLNPLHQMIHVFLTIDTYRVEVKDIANRLRIDAAMLEESLRLLERMGLIEISDGKVVVKRKEVHLSADSPVYPHYRMMHRMKTIALLQQNFETRPSDYFISAIFSANEETKRFFRQRFQQLLKEVQSLVGKSPEEKVFQFNFDLFEW